MEPTEETLRNFCDQAFSALYFANCIVKRVIQGRSIKFFDLENYFIGVVRLVEQTGLEGLLSDHALLILSELDWLDVEFDSDGKLIHPDKS